MEDYQVISDEAFMDGYTPTRKPETVQVLPAIDFSDPCIIPDDEELNRVLELLDGAECAGAKRLVLILFYQGRY